MAEVFQKYMGSGLMLVWFVLALVYLFLHEKHKPLRILFIYTPIIVMLLFFNPLFYRLFQATVGTEIYFRLCWLLPVTIVIAYTIVRIYTTLSDSQKENASKKTGFAITAVLILLISGNPVYNNPLYSPAENSYHVPQAVVDICDAIQVDGREVMSAFPDEFLLYVRQYSPVVCMPYGREAYIGKYNELNVLLMDDEINVERLAALAKAAGCHYVILEEGKTFLGHMTDYNYELFDTMYGYEIYRDNSMNFEVS